MYRAEYSSDYSCEIIEYEFYADNSKHAYEIAWNCEVGRGNLENLYQIDNKGNVVKKIC
jgi:hypothetical protein